MTILPRPELAQVLPVTHGGHHDETGELLDFSANLNPFGPSPQVAAALHSVPIDRHPDPRARPLRAALAQMLRCDEQQIITANGAADLIYQLAVAFVRPGDRVLIAGPTFGEYAAACAMMGANLNTVAFWPPRSSATDLARLLTLAQEQQPRLLFICNPNNPTGGYLASSVIETLLDSLPNTLIVLDEAYRNFVMQPWDAAPLLLSGNLLILRSLTKDYALTGLRAGYALAAPQLVAALDIVQPPWNVNAFAQAGAIAALADQTHLLTTLAALASATVSFRAALAQQGWQPLTSATSFFLLPVTNARDASTAMLKAGIRVRDCSSFGLPQHLRIATQKPEANQRFLETLAALGRFQH